MSLVPVGSSTPVKFAINNHLRSVVETLDRPLTSTTLSDALTSANNAVELLSTGDFFPPKNGSDALRYAQDGAAKLDFAVNPPPNALVDIEGNARAAQLDFKSAIAAFNRHHF